MLPDHRRLLSRLWRRFLFLRKTLCPQRQKRKRTLHDIGVIDFDTAGGYDYDVWEETSRK